MNSKLIRYRGDAADVAELYENYNLEGIIAAAEAQQITEDASFRNRLLKDGAFLLSRPISPRIFDLVTETRERLDFKGDFEVFCFNDHMVNAFAHVQPGKAHPFFTIAITSGALESLSDAEIKYILGHEFGHFIYDHNRMGYLISHNPDSPALTILPSFGEAVYLRWRKKSEISADRLGLFACGSFDDAARGMLKAAYGLTDRNLNVDVDMLLKQIDDLKDDPEALELTYVSHPLMPLRLKVLSLFAASPVYLALSQGDAGSISKVDTTELEDRCDKWVNWIKRHPRRPIAEAVMMLVAAVGIQIVRTDDDINEEEVRTAIHILHYHFTDEPELVIREIVGDIKNIDARIEKYAKTVNDLGGEEDKLFVLSRLADIAIADGKLLKPEAGLIFKIASMLNIKEERAYGMLVGAMNTLGLTIDAKMNNLVKETKALMLKSVF